MNDLARQADRDRVAWASLINRIGQLSDELAAIVQTPCTEQQALTVADSLDLLCEQVGHFRATLPQSALDRLAALNADRASGGQSGTVPEPQTGPAAMHRFMREHPLTMSAEPPEPLAGRDGQAAGPGRYWAPLRGSGTCPDCGVQPGELHTLKCGAQDSGQEPSLHGPEAVHAEMNAGPPHPPRTIGGYERLAAHAGHEPEPPGPGGSGPRPEAGDEGGLPGCRYILPADYGRGQS